ncbi:hypothetical protein L6164_017489 [Bauhinia variegata]|uniref:Uncharacterized protein n=1 Tax=Bauhinia variegata TaxID=167791 RepID=A0ACB9N8A4_BAUVA|nr:hypothetical protein L6164_017489 [Bauhinia variegata]
MLYMLDIGRMPFSLLQEVKKIMLPSDVYRKSCKGISPRELFTLEHAELRRNAESWMNGTVAQPTFVMLISTVIAIGIFAVQLAYYVVLGISTVVAWGGKIRDTLFQLLESEVDVIIKHGAQSRESRRAASQGMHTSKFCLHPAGDTPSACRLFDAILSLCVPGIVSDDIELPFEDTIDYRKIAIFVETSAAVKPGYLVSMLRAVASDRILEYQKELKEVKRYFQYGEADGTVNEIWRQVSKKLPLIKLMINRDKRVVRKEPDCSCLCTNQTASRTL